MIMKRAVAAFIALGLYPTVSSAITINTPSSKLLVAISTVASRARANSPNANAVSNYQVKPLYEAAPAIDYEDCFWQQPFFYGGKIFYKAGFAGSLNANIDNISSTYWATSIKLKKGETLTLRGQFGHNRYASIQSYGPINPTASLKDWEIIPDKGIEFNPYINGNRRDTPMEDRWFTINVTNALAPTDGTAASNTLYAATPDCELPECDPEFINLRWRSYLVDQKYDDIYDTRGGGQIPLPIGFNGTCERPPGNDTDAILSYAKTFINSEVPVARVLQAWQDYPCPQNVSACNPNGFCNDQWTAPAQVKPVFEKFFSQKYSEQGLYVPPELRNSPVGETCSDSKNCPEGCNELGYRPPEGSGCNIAGAPGIPANFDNNYGTFFINDKFGKVARITAKYPITPRTYWNTKIYDNSTADMRYWSWTSANTRTTGSIVDGLDDEQIPMLKDGTYNIFISLPENRPASANQACGSAWMNWGRSGDGAGRWSQNIVTLRHLTPSPNFMHALQNVCDPGSEQQVMGAYYPKLTYYATAEEAEAAVGCARDKVSLTPEMTVCSGNTSRKKCEGKATLNGSCKWDANRKVCLVNPNYATEKVVVEDIVKIQSNSAVVVSQADVMISSIVMLVGFFMAI